MPRPARVIGVFKIVDQSASIIIELLHHRAVKWIVLPFFGPSIFVRFSDFHSQLALVFTQQRFAVHHDRRVHQPRGEIEEEWFVLIFPHKRHGILGRLIKGKAILIQTVRIFGIAGSKPSQTIRHTVLHATAVAGVVEALILWLRIAVMTHRHMPLSAVSSRVAICFERFGDRHRFHWHADAIPGGHDRPTVTMGMGRLATRNVRHLRTGGMISAQNRSTRRRTGRSGRIGLPKEHPLFRQRIEIRRFHRRRCVDVIALHILPTEIIGEQQNNIRLFRTLGGGRSQRHGQYTKD